MLDLRRFLIKKNRGFDVVQATIEQLNFNFHRTMLYTDPITFYSILSGYRTMEYAQTSTWVLLEPAELLFTYAKQLIFTDKNGKQIIL